MGEYQFVRRLYLTYMLENELGVWKLAKRLNAAWRARGQLPRIGWRLFPPKRTLSDHNGDNNEGD